MKDVVLNKSWHLWLANFGEKRIDPAWGTDICEYTRAMVVGSFWALVAFTFIGLFVSWTGFTLYDIFCAMFLGGTLYPPSLIYIMLCAALLAIIAIAALKHWIDNRPVKDAPPKPPSIAKVVYRKVKDKTCFRIKFQ